MCQIYEKTVVSTASRAKLGAKLHAMFDGFMSLWVKSRAFSSCLDQYQHFCVFDI